MDEYGYSAAMKAGLAVFEMSGRGSGRTMRMIERAADEDRIVTTTPREAKRIERILRERGKKTAVVALEPSALPMERLSTQPLGRTWFDHLWQQAYYEHRMAQADSDLEFFQKAVSKTWPENEADFLADRNMGERARHAFGDWEKTNPAAKNPTIKI